MPAHAATHADDTRIAALDARKASRHRAYVQGKFGALTLSGGKFALPFHRTDLVWDGDFNTQSAAAVIDLPRNGTGLSSRLAALYAVLDEAPAGKDSDLFGVQTSLSTGKHPGRGLDLSGSYLNYHLNSLAGADAGNFRSNLRRADGSYLLNFELIDCIATLHLAGVDKRWAVSLTAEAVRNFGAATHADTGLLASVAVYTTNYTHGTRVRSGYLQAKADAVFAAFSRDNIGLATNYRLHQFAVDHALTPSSTLNPT
ncbi:putative porin [Novosphingobium sp. BW1]|uniref:putative porin n=1 Tax=Novosphingobium sp. BW1 TaxID=2592621 RepID=UPI0011DE6387|nr:putative porin [Novosphingobium sp. BW1]TYC94424.1 hypothetical protein FMM79_00765 [Novosphingobium sp. BW1]